MSKPLTGVVVIETSTMITGPLAGMMLADLGADVIKVENPEGGDPFRSFRGGKYSPYFLAFNRNKRSIALDLRSSEGREDYKKLIAGADVMIENFRPGVLDRLGLGTPELRKINPRLIACSISGFGSSGPYKDRPAYDAVAQALSGISSLMFHGQPQITGPTIADNLTGIFACYGILAALVEREKTGVARAVEVNMLDSSIAFMPDAFLTATLLGIKPGPFTRVQASQSYAVACADQTMLAVHLSSQEKFWEGCVEAFERPALKTDLRFDTRAKRVDNYLQLAEELRRAAATQPRAYWETRLNERDVPWAPVNSVLETMEDEQVTHLGTFAEMKHPELGSYMTIRRPVTFDGVRDDQPLSLPPELNENDRDVRRDFGITAPPAKALSSAS
jgi:crotonobetainyl-CoA:carnitine CoA-transferase CaiB-like acyl-CoA transferase